MKMILRIISCIKLGILEVSLLVLWMIVGVTCEPLVRSLGFKNELFQLVAFIGISLYFYLGFLILSVNRYMMLTKMLNLGYIRWAEARRYLVDLVKNSWLVCNLATFINPACVFLFNAIYGFDQSCKSIKDKLDEKNTLIAERFGIPHKVIIMFLFISEVVLFPLVAGIVALNLFWYANEVFVSVPVFREFGGITGCVVIGVAGIIAKIMILPVDIILITVLNKSVLKDYIIEDDICLKNSEKNDD